MVQLYLQVSVDQLLIIKKAADTVGMSHVWNVLMFVLCLKEAMH